MATQRLGGLYVPTTQIIETQVITDNQEFSDDLKQILIRIVQAFNDISLSLNLKESGLYPLEEFVNSNVYFPNPALSSLTAQTPVGRQEFTMTINFGALPNNTTKSVAHNINVTANTTWTCIRAFGTNPSALTLAGIAIPSSSVSGNIINIYTDDTNVNIETNFDASAYTRCIVVLKYLQQ